MQYQDINMVPDVALPYSGRANTVKSVNGVSMRSNMNNSTSGPVSSPTTLQDIDSKPKESKAINVETMRFE